MDAKGVFTGNRKRGAFLILGDHEIVHSHVKPDHENVHQAPHRPPKGVFNNNVIGWGNPGFAATKFSAPS